MITNEIQVLPQPMISLANTKLTMPMTVLSLRIFVGQHDKCIGKLSFEHVSLLNNTSAVFSSLDWISPHSIS